MVRIIPDSTEARLQESWQRAMSRKRQLREYNKCHNPKGEAGGKFCSDPEGSGGGDALRDRVKGIDPQKKLQYAEDRVNKVMDAFDAKKAGGAGNLSEPGDEYGPGQVNEEAAAQREPVIHVDTVEEAAELLLAGHNVEVDDIQDVNTLLRGLASMATDAYEKGQNAPNYDLCKVSVAGTNLFCTGKMRTPEHPDGVIRHLMPQIGGTPMPGSEADKLPKKPNGDVDGTKQYIAHLRSQGIDVTEIIPVPAANLKASQAELVGPQVAGMMGDTTYDPSAEPIFISRDGYVVDGHHRWAAQVGRDAADGNLGTSTMHVYKIDAPISEVIKISQDWSKNFGIKGKKAGDEKPKITRAQVKLKSGATSRSKSYPTHITPIHKLPKKAPAAVGTR